MTTRDVRGPIVITHEGGLEFAAHVRSHRIVVDQPTHARGGDMGPTPVELLGAAIGACVALYVQQFCHTRGLSYEGLRVEVEQHAASIPNRVGRFVVHIVVPPDVPDYYREKLERVARGCPVYNTLTHGVEINVLVQQLEPV